MKKFLFAASFFMAGMAATSVLAFENQFGGEWRTRAYTQKDFYADEKGDVSQVDTRTQLYYTAKFNDNFMFVNKFEMGDIAWGQAGTYGKIGADGIDVEVKNTYADFTPIDNLNFKIGAQGTILSRSFLFDDDFSGAVITYDAGMAKIPFLWMKYNEGGIGKDANDEDMDAYVLNPLLDLGNGLTINPMLAYMTQESTETDEFFIALNADMTNDNLNAWFTGIYQGGSVDSTDSDLSAYLVAVGAAFKLDKLEIHGQTFYASGDDNTNDTDMEAFTAPLGQSYYWSEIMGYGMFDNQWSNGSCGDRITNITAASIGASFKPVDKLTLGADIWYAMLNEVADDADDELGTEIDLKAQYMIFDNLALDVVAAYLFAGDATGEDDPYEIGTQLKLAF